MAGLTYLRQDRGRKYDLVLFGFLTSVLLLCAGLIDQGTWLAFSSMTIGAYIAGNVVQRVGTK